MSIIIPIITNSSSSGDASVTITEVTATSGMGTYSYAVQSTDEYIACDSTERPIEITLEQTPVTGRTVIVKDVSGTSADIGKNVSIVRYPGGEFIFSTTETSGTSQVYAGGIRGADSPVAYGGTKFVFDGNKWIASVA
jgi:hypothetical protein